MEQLQKAAGAALVGIAQNSNVNVESDQHLPTGLTLYMNPDARVDPGLISDHLGQVLTVTSILKGPQGAELNDAYFSQRKEDIQRAVEQFSRRPASLSALSPTEPKDVRVWDSEMGGANSFVGIYSKMSEDHMHKEHFIVAQGAAPVAVRELKEKLNTPSGAMTYRELADSPELRSVEDLAMRNVCRNAATVAEVCHCLIHRVFDESSARSNANVGAPEMASPDWVAPLFSVRNTTYEGAPAVALHCGVIPSDGPRSNVHYVVRSPVQGLVAFPITRTAEAIALPADMGAPKEEVNNKLIGGVLFEGTQSAALAGSSTAIEKKVREEMKQGGGWNPEDHTQILMQVTTKIYNRDLRRPKE